MLSVKVFRIVKLYAFVLSIPMLSVTMLIISFLCIDMLSVVILSVIILSVTAPHRELKFAVSLTDFNPLEECSFQAEKNSANAFDVSTYNLLTA